MPIPASQAEWRRAVVARAVDLGAAHQQQCDNIDVTLAARNNERCLARFVHSMDLGATLPQQSRGVDVTL